MRDTVIYAVQKVSTRSPSVEDRIADEGSAAGRPEGIKG